MWKDKFYYDNSPYNKIIKEVSDISACCQLCKEDFYCEKVSYGLLGGKYAKECYLTGTGGHLVSDDDFMCSPEDISDCSCDKGTMASYLVKMNQFICNVIL